MTLRAVGSGRHVYCGALRRLLRPVAWCALALVASVPVTALACQWECAFEQAATGHHSAHQHEAAGSASSTVARIGGSGDYSCAHPATAAPAITAEAFRFSAETVGPVISNDIDVVPSVSSVARLSPPADHSPPGLASRFLILRI